MNILEINNLHAKVDEKEILKGINLKIKPGEIHAIMGPNGSGKSTLSYVLSRKPDFTVTDGSVTFNDKDLLSLEADECAKEGLFLCFQYPVAIPGVSNIQFIKSSVNAIRKYQDKSEYDTIDFLEETKKHIATLGMSEDLLYRNLNEGFSGGEKKRNEILQMSLLEPKLAILDETDSGLDIDALKSVAEGIKNLHKQGGSILLITHYKRLLEYVEPDYIHVLKDGVITQSGDKTLANELEEKGYRSLEINQKD